MISELRRKWRDKQHRAPIFFTASSVWLSLVQLVSGVAIVHFVTPHDMGLWSSANLALAYSVFLLAGVQNGLSRDLPYFLGANDEPMARRLASTTLFYTLACGVTVFLAGLAVVAYLVWGHADTKVTYAAAAVVPLILFRFYQNYLFITFRSKNSFIDLARVQMWTAAVAIFSLPLLFLTYNGLLLRALVVAAVGLALMHRARPLSVPSAWKTNSFLLLLKTGLPIFATDYIANCAATCDRLVLLSVSGVEQVGYYSLAISAYSAFIVIPQSVAHYIYPRMSHHYGRTNNPRVLWGMAWKTSATVAVTMLPIAAVGCWLLPVVIRLMFPKYAAGTYAAQVALFTGVAYGATMGSNALSSLKAWSHLVFYQMSYAALLAIGPFVGVRMFKSPLTGVAYGMLSANVVAVALSLAVTFAATHRRQNDRDIEQFPEPEAMRHTEQPAIAG